VNWHVEFIVGTVNSQNNTKNKNRFENVSRRSILLQNGIKSTEVSKLLVFNFSPIRPVLLKKSPKILKHFLMLI
jgi:hypothetical protein